MNKLLQLSFICLGILAFSQKNKTAKTSSISHKNPSVLFDPTPFAFSHSTTNNTEGQYVFISGQSGGEDLNHHLSADFRTQVKYSLKNLEAVLKEYGLGVKDILKITILIVDHDQEKLKIWSEEMHNTWQHNNFPASTLVPVPRLALDGMMIEVDAIAFLKKQQHFSFQ